MTNLLETAKSSLSFLGICLLTFIAILLIAKVFEKYVIKINRKVSGTKYASFIAMFSALSAVLMLFEIPLFFAPSFYKFDFSELPVLMSSFYLGPVAGVITGFLKVFIKLLLKGTSTAFVGDYANFVTCMSLVLPASIIYHLNKSKKGALIGMIAGTISLTVIGSTLNAFYLIPKFAELFGLPLDTIVAMGTAINPSITSVNTLVLFAVVPFNLLKGTIISIITRYLYKRVEKLLFK